MSQFNNLKESYQNVDRRAPYPNNSDNESDDDSPPPPVPSHDQKYQTGLQGKLSALAQDAATSRGAGGMINGSSSESRSQGQQNQSIFRHPLRPRIIFIEYIHQKRVTIVELMCNTLFLQNV